MQYLKLTVTTDGEADATYAGYITEEHAGVGRFESPLFDKETAIKILKDANMPYVFDGSKIITGWDGEEIELQLLSEHNIQLFEFHALGWTWEISVD